MLISGISPKEADYPAITFTQDVQTPDSLIGHRVIHVQTEDCFSVWTALLGQIGGGDFKLQYTQSLNNLQAIYGHSQPMNVPAQMSPGTGDDDDVSVGADDHHHLGYDPYAAMENGVGIEDVAVDSVYVPTGSELSNSS
ncbi:hypothetical protein LWI28_024330 [Acer negundo]|uniref:Uncharacterized protein n=1 Tax=Acer negundo TaxID=4023 RepID=A0AAD5JVT8_ACENE|nr:hypothetical protein LWI28_024330 [Acer negundo]